MSAWQPYSQQFYSTLPVNVADWLTKTPRLVEALKARYANFQFALLSENFAPVAADEKQALALDTPTAWLRQVTEGTAQQVLVYSRVVIPSATFEAFQQAFSALGDHPIGNYLLYDNPDVTRAAFEFAEVFVGEGYDDALQVLGHSRVWARRSIFRWCNHPLLISEFFSPDLVTHETC